MDFGKSFAQRCSALQLGHRPGRWPMGDLLLLLPGWLWKIWWVFLKGLSNCHLPVLNSPPPPFKYSACAPSRMGNNFQSTWETFSTRLQIDWKWPLVLFSVIWTFHRWKAIDFFFLFNLRPILLQLPKVDDKKKPKAQPLVLLEIAGKLWRRCVKTTD